jgi:hypothetical protein
MIMPAPDGNANASKWTLQATLDTLKKIEYYAEEDRVYTLGRALSLSGVYQGVWSYWKRKWVDNEEVMEMINFIDQLFVNKLMEGAITKRLHYGMCMFALRVNHGISDKPLKEGEKEPEEKIPAYLSQELALPVDPRTMRKKESAPNWVKRVPKMFTTIRPKDGSVYREAFTGLFTTYSPEECRAAMLRVFEHELYSDDWINGVLPEEEYVREKMQQAA